MPRFLIMVLALLCISLKSWGECVNRSLFINVTESESNATQNLNTPLRHSEGGTTEEPSIINSPSTLEKKVKT